MVGFLFGGNTGVTREDLEKRRRIEQMLASRQAGSTPRNLGEGLAHVGRDIEQGVAGYTARKMADKVKAQEEEAFQEALAKSGAAPEIAALAGLPGGKEAIVGLLSETHSPRTQLAQDRFGLAKDQFAHARAQDEIANNLQRQKIAIARQKAAQRQAPQFQSTLGKTVADIRAMRQQGMIDDAQAAQMLKGAMAGKDPLVSINNGPQGKLPTGFRWVGDGQGGFVAEAIPGTPQALEAQQNARADEQRVRSQAQADSYKDVAREDMDRALAMIKESPTWTTGIVGQMLSGVGNTAAHDLNSLLTTLESSIGFDRLQAMREASPTGGALGQVSERELAQLNAALGSIRQSQNPDQLSYNIDRMARVYDEIIHGPQRGRSGSQPTPNPDPRQAPRAPAGIDPREWEHMTPEERKLFE